MNLWEYLDRVGERRARRPSELRLFIGLAFLAGYYWMVHRFISAVIPNGNVPLVRDAMLVLGPAVGLIVGALFRSDARDEQAAAGQREATRAMREVAAGAVAAAQAGGPGAAGAADAVACAADQAAERFR
jgi:hypothetical protein